MARAPIGVLGYFLGSIDGYLVPTAVPCDGAMLTS
jgi:hypothetical protein